MSLRPTCSTSISSRRRSHERRAAGPSRKRGVPVSFPRFLCSGELAPGDVDREYALPDAVAHHALRVLRLGPGDRVTLFTGAGGEFAATLKRADKRDAEVHIDAFDPVE